ncbi:8821_t:CDS:1, partial [Scutellospora calospora]
RSRNGTFVKRNGVTTAMEPATTDIIKFATPISSPPAKELES